MSFDILCVGWNKNEESEWYVVPRKIVNLNNIYTGRMIMMEYYHNEMVENWKLNRKICVFFLEIIV